MIYTRNISYIVFTFRVWYAILAYIIHGIVLLNVIKKYNLWRLIVDHAAIDGLLKPKTLAVVGASFYPWQNWIHCCR
jgi:hypothetical protein